jgi:hypothetical protein
MSVDFLFALYLLILILTNSVLANFVFVATVPQHHVFYKIGIIPKNV